MLNATRDAVLLGVTSIFNTHLSVFFLTFFSCSMLFFKSCRFFLTLSFSVDDMKHIYYVHSVDVTYAIRYTVRIRHGGCIRSSVAEYRCRGNDFRRSISSLVVRHNTKIYFFFLPLSRSEKSPDGPSSTPPGEPKVIGNVERMGHITREVSLHLFSSFIAGHFDESFCFCAFSVRITESGPVSAPILS